MAVSTLAKQGEDKIIRQADQHRQDEIYFNSMYIIRTEQSEAENEKLRQELAKLKSQLKNS